MDYPKSVANIGLVGGKFVDENPATGQVGSLVPSAWGNSVTDELLAVIAAGGLTPSEADVAQLLKAIRSGAITYAVDIGAANALVVAFTPTITALADGMVLRVKVASGNTGATTLNVGAGGVKSVVGLAGQPLQGGELVTGGRATFMWAEAQGVWVLQLSQSSSLQVAAASQGRHAVTASQMQTGFGTYAADTGSAGAIVVALTPAPAALVDGMLIRVIIASGTGGATTLNLNGLGAKAVLGLGGFPLQGGEIVSGGRATFIWAASQNAWILQSCQSSSLQVADGSQSHHAVTLGQFLATLTGNDYLKIPAVVGGVLRTVIIQWCTSASISAGGTGSVTLPLTFPNAAVFAIAAPLAVSGNSNAGNVVAGTPGVSSVPLYNWGSAIAAPAKVLAIGY